MKKYWRCHVCNDIHLGVKPPEICPTCLVKNAYVEVATHEAQKIMSLTVTTIDKEAFVSAIENFAEESEFCVNPDKEKVSMLLEGIFNNEENYGLKYCPCRMIEKDLERDIKLICPCNFIIHETYKDKDDGECWCGMFIKRSQNE